MSAPDDEVVVAIDGVGKRFAGRNGILEALAPISLRVARGELLSIVGPSGCGKTTLLRIIQGLETPSSGTVSIHGDGEHREDVGFVFQQASLFPWWSVRKNIEFGLRLRARRHGGEAVSRSRVDEMLELVGLGGFGDYLPSEVSGGMQQRANLARALAIDPAVLLLDEPFSAVDALTKERLQLVLDELLATLHTTAVLVTHDIREAVFLGTRVAVMGGRPGHLVDLVPIDVPRPRGEAFQHSDELAQLSRDIYSNLVEPRPPRDAAVAGGAEVFSLSERKESV